MLSAVLQIKSMQSLGQSFVMSSVGGFSGTNTISIPMQFKSTDECIDIQSGIAVLSGIRNKGEFAINCGINFKVNSLGIKMFPVPAANRTKVRFTNTPPLKDQFEISVYSRFGVLVMTQKATGYDLFQGVDLDLSKLFAGAYYIKIESGTYSDATKFIKGNYY
jgi:hypothetical protein